MEVINGQLHGFGFWKLQSYKTIHVIAVAQVDFQAVVSHQFSKSTVISQDFRRRQNRLGGTEMVTGGGTNG